LMAKTTFPVWLWNTFFIAVVSTLISLFCGLLAGYALARLKFPMAGTLGTSIFVTYLVPPTLLFIPLADIIRNFQLGNTPSALIRGDIYFWGQLMAGALLGSIPVALVYSFFVEYYVTGLTGSVKG